MAYVGFFLFLLAILFVRVVSAPGFMKLLGYAFLGGIAWALCSIGFGQGAIAGIIIGCLIKAPKGAAAPSGGKGK